MKINLYRLIAFCLLVIYGTNNKALPVHVGGQVSITSGNNNRGPARAFVAADRARYIASYRNTMRIGSFNHFSPVHQVSFLQSKHEVVSLMGKSFDAEKVNHKLYAIADGYFNKTPIDKKQAIYCTTVPLSDWQQMVKDMPVKEAAHCYILYQYPRYREAITEAAKIDSQLQNELIGIGNKISQDESYKKELDSLKYNITKNLISMSNDAVAARDTAAAHERNDPVDKMRRAQELAQFKQEFEKYVVVCSKTVGKNDANYDKQQKIKIGKLNAVACQLEALQKEGDGEITDFGYYSTELVNHLKVDGVIRLEKLGVKREDFACVANKEQDYMHEQFLAGFRFVADKAKPGAITAANNVDITPVLKQAVNELKAGIVCNRKADVTGSFKHLGNYYDIQNALESFEGRASQYKDMPQKLVAMKDSVVKEYEHNFEQRTTQPLMYVHNVCDNQCDALCQFQGQHAERRILFDRGVCLSERKDALEQVVGGDRTVDLQKYALSPLSKQVLEQSNIQPYIFEQCIGNPIQQALHVQAINLLNGASQQQSLQSTDKIVIAKLARNSVETAKVGNIEQAQTCIDLGHAWLTVQKYGQTIINGTVKGVGYVQHALTNWQEMYTSLRELVSISADMPCVLATVTNNHWLKMPLNKIYGEQQMKMVAARLQAFELLANNVAAMTGPEMVEEAIAQGVSTVLLGGIFKGVGTVTRLTAVQAARAAQPLVKVAKATQAYQKIASTAESIQASLARSRVHYLGEKAEAVIADMELKVPASSLMEAEQVGVGGAKASKAVETIKVITQAEKTQAFTNIIHKTFSKIEGICNTKLKDLEHILDRHLPGGKDVHLKPNTSLFIKSENLLKQVEDIAQYCVDTWKYGEISKVVGGKIIKKFDCGKTIGLDMFGRPTSKIQVVVVEQSQRIISAYPIH